MLLDFKIVASDPLRGGYAHLKCRAEGGLAKHLVEGGQSGRACGTLGPAWRFPGAGLQPEGTGLSPLLGGSNSLRVEGGKSSSVDKRGNRTVNISSGGNAHFSRSLVASGPLSVSLTAPMENLFTKQIKVSFCCRCLTMWTINETNIAQNSLVNTLFSSVYRVEVNLTLKGALNTARWFAHNRKRSFKHLDQDVLWRILQI